MTTSALDTPDNRMLELGRVTESDMRLTAVAPGRGG